MRLTEGHLLGGRVRYAQPAEGFRSGIEPVLLAAVGAGPAGRAGAGRRQRRRRGAALPGGARAGAGRGGGGTGCRHWPHWPPPTPRRTGVDGLSFLAAPLEGGRSARTVRSCHGQPALSSAAAARPRRTLARERAKRARPGLLAAWASGSAAPLRRHGSLTLILPAAPPGRSAWPAMQAAQCPAAAVLPLWPKSGRPGQAGPGAGATARPLPACGCCPAWCCTKPDGRFTPETAGVLRGGAALDWG